MRVFYDHQILYLQKYGGISRYFHELIRHLISMYPDDSFDIKAAISQNYYFRDMVPQRRLFRHGNRFINNVFMKYEILRADVAGKGIDIIHPTYYMPEYLDEWMRKRSRLVITVHDMTYEHYMQSDKGIIEARRKLFLQADGIITVSENTRNDLLNIYPGLGSKPVCTIYHGCIDPVGKACDPAIPLPGEYILYVGSRSGYKDFPMLIKAFAAIADKYGSVSIICAGGGEFGAKEKKLISEAGLEGRVIQRSMSDGELSLAYKNAICFVYPSQYEGFGLPILEAFENSCPVILRNASCFPEIAGDAALYFDDVEELSESISSMIDDKEKREELSEKGTGCLQRYSWEKAAEETYDFYGKILGA